MSLVMDIFFNSVSCFFSTSSQSKKDPSLAGGWDTREADDATPLVVEDVACSSSNNQEMRSDAELAFEDVFSGVNPFKNADQATVTDQGLPVKSKDLVSHFTSSLK